MRGLLDITYYILTHQSSGNWGRHAKQHISFINFESLEIYWIYFLSFQTTTPKIPSMRLMSLDHELKIRWCAMRFNHEFWWDNIAMGFGPWALLGFKREFPKIHDNIDVVWVVNEIKPCSVKILSLTAIIQQFQIEGKFKTLCIWDFFFFNVNIFKFNFY